jgi:hypothetical protein
VYCCRLSSSHLSSPYWKYFCCVVTSRSLCSKFTEVFVQLNSTKLIGSFALIDDGGLQGVRTLDRSVVINTFQFGNDLVLDLVATESASLADDTDYDFRDAALSYSFNAYVNRKLYDDGYLIPDCLSNLYL